MNAEKLKKANELNSCLETLHELKAIFEGDKYQLAVNQIRAVGLTEDILEEWRLVNTLALDRYIKDTEKAFEEL